MDCTTLLLIDDHPLFRKGLAQLFGASDDFEWWGRPPAAAKASTWP
jgi:two-component system nitrate/nitrite response regulator NarL